jgi:hypothetical protein
MRQTIGVRLRFSIFLTSVHLRSDIESTSILASELHGAVAEMRIDLKVFGME